MQITYAFSETKNGLRRNLTMTIALVVTIFISLTLVGMGILLNAQANNAREAWGDKLQLTVFLCSKATQVGTDAAGTCASGDATPEEKAAIEGVLKDYPEVKSYTERSKAEAYAIFKRIYDEPGNDRDRALFDTVTEDTMQESYLVTLKDPNKYEGVTSALSGMKGVDRVQDLRNVLGPIYFVMSVFKWGAIGIAAFLLAAAVLQVSNSIRLAVFARRKEIGIMRLVGASNVYISLPFLMETLVAAVIAIALSGAALAAFMKFAVYDLLRDYHLMPWITWADAFQAGWMIAAVGVVLTTVPTLVMTRKYLKV